MTQIKPFPYPPLSFRADPSFHGWAGKHSTEVIVNDLREGGSLLRNNKYEELSRFFASRGISRSPHSLWQFSAAYHAWIDPILNENRVWQTLENWTDGLTSSLNQAGYLPSGFLRRIRGAEDGIRLLQIINDHKPEDMSILQVLAYFHEQFKTDSRYKHDPERPQNNFDFFGPWDADGKKSINATLRCWALFMERFSGTVEERELEALLHPLRGERAQNVLDLCARHTELTAHSGAGTLVPSIRSIIHDKNNEYHLTIPRLRVETSLLNNLLEKDLWWFKKLLPGRKASDLVALRKEYLTEFLRMREALFVLSPYMTEAPSN